MTRKGIVLFGIVILVMALVVPGVASATTYHGFTATLHEAYEGSDWGFNPPPSLGDPDDRQITNGTELTKLNYSDDERICYNTGGSYDYHKFKFKIDEDVSDITRIFMLHEGYGSGGHALRIWNYTAGVWEIVDSTNEEGPPDKILMGIRTGGFANYIQGGYLYLLAIANESENTICTDYVRVEINNLTAAAVGGEVLPVDKVTILAPWLGLFALTALAIGAVVVRKRRAA